jgi:hypothetical protein
VVLAHMQPFSGGKTWEDGARFHYLCRGDSARILKP